MAKWQKSHPDVFVYTVYLACLFNFAQNHQKRCGFIIRWNSKISVIQPVKKLVEVDTAQRQNTCEYACFSAARLKSKTFNSLIIMKLWKLQSVLSVSMRSIKIMLCVLRIDLQVQLKLMVGRVNFDIERALNENMKVKFKVSINYARKIQWEEHQMMIAVTA